MRLVDADAYSAEMKERQEAAWKWRNEAIAEEDEVKLARAEGAYTAFTEAKLTMDKHIINPWHRVEEALPEKFVNVILANKRGKHYDIDKGWWNGYSFDRCAKGIYRNVTHWMPLPEPPKEDA